MGEREERFARLFASAYGPLWAYARRRAPADDVDDIVAEPFTVAWRRLDEVPEPALPWLYGVAYKVIGNLLRSRRRGLRLIRRLAAEPGPAARHEPSAVLDALATLPVSLEMVGMFTWVHALVFALIGGIAAWYRGQIRLIGVEPAANMLRTGNGLSSAEAVASGLTVKELVIQKRILEGRELEEVLDLWAMTELGVPGGKGVPAGG